MATMASLLVKIGADTSGMIAGMKKGQAEVAGFAGAMERTGAKSFALGKSMTMGVTLPLAGIAWQAIKTTEEYEKTLNTMGAVAQVPQKQLRVLDALAIKLGQDTIFSTNEAMKAMLELSKGGISVANIQAGALANTLDLAAAAEMDLAESAVILGSAMNTFNLTGTDSKRIVDALAGAANASSADLPDLALALRSGGSAAARFNISIEETAGMLALLADRGIRGSDAGTLLKSQLRTLVPVTEKAQERMKKLGLDFFDASGKFIGMAGVADELKDSLGGLSDEQRELAINQLFGSDASRLAGILLKEGSGILREYTEAASEAGAASEVAAAKMKGLPGSLEQLRGSVETALLTLGRRMAPTITDLADTVTRLLNQFTSLPKPIQQTVLKIGTFLLLAGPLMMLFGAMSSTVGKLAKGVKALGTASGIMKAGIGIAVIALMNFARSFENARVEAEKMVDSLDKESQILEFKNDIDRITASANDMSDRIAQGFSAIVTGAPTAGQKFNALAQEADDLRASLDEMTTTEAQIANAKAALINRTLHLSYATENINKAWGKGAIAAGGYSSAQEYLSNAQRSASIAEAEYRRVLQLTTIAEAEAVIQGEKLLETRRRLAGIVDSLTEAEIRVKQSRRGLVDAQKALNALEEEGITKGRRHAEAIEAVKMAAIGWRNAIRNVADVQQVLVDNVAAATNEGRTSAKAVEKLARSFGVSKKQFNNMVGDFKNGSARFNELIDKLKISDTKVGILQQAFESLQLKAQTSSTETASSFTTMVGSIKGIVGGLPSWFATIGQAVITGFVSSLNGGLGSVVSAAWNIAIAARDSAKRGLKSDSPSKVFRDIGVDVVRGFNLGLRNTKIDMFDVPSPKMPGLAMSGGATVTQVVSATDIAERTSRTQPNVIFQTRGKPDKKFAKDSMQELDWMRRTEPFSGR